MRTPMKLTIFLISVLLTSTLNAKQKYYKWVDAQGNIHYSETKPKKNNTSEVKIYNKIAKDQVQHYVSRSEKEKLAQQAKNQKEGKTQDQVEIEEFNKKQKAKAKKAQDRANCKIAKNNLATLQKTTRIRRKNAKTGEYVRIDDKDRIKMLKLSKASIKKLCK